MADGANALNINWNLYDSNGNPLLTQFAEASASSGTTQDGVQPGTATGVTLQNGGALVASYSNGQQVTIAQVAVASVANPDSLIAVSNNNFTLGCQYADAIGRDRRNRRTRKRRGRFARSLERRHGYRVHQPDRLSARI